MNLVDLIDEDQEAWVSAPVDPRFEIKIKFASKDTIQRMHKNATVSKYDTKLRQRFDEVDDKHFVQNFVQECVLDWKGLTVGVLRKMIPLKKGDLDDDTEVEFSHQSALELIDKDTTDLGVWLLEAVRDLENFSKKT